MRARVTVTADVNTLALHRMLVENGLWLVQVHNRRIVKVSKVPRGAEVEAFVNGEEGEQRRDAEAQSLEEGDDIG